MTENVPSKYQPCFKYGCEKSPCIVMLLILITHGMQRLEQELGFVFDLFYKF